MWFAIGGGVVAVAALGTWLVFAWGSSGRLGRNPIIGIRTAVTRTSDAAWVDTHHAAMMQSTGFMIGAVVAGVAAIVQFSDAGSAAFAFWLALGVYVIGLARGIYKGVRAAESAK